MNNFLKELQRAGEKNKSFLGLGISERGWHKKRIFSMHMLDVFYIHI
jgi:hypothetical protein